MRLEIQKVLVEPTMPSLVDLDAASAAGVMAEVPDHAGCKALAKACLPDATYKALCIRSPACWPTLAVFILSIASGVDKPSIDPDATVGLTVLDPETDKLPEAMAAAYVAQEASSKMLFEGAEEDDPRRRLYAVAFGVGGERHYALLRFPSEREVDSFRKFRSPSAAKAFIRSTCVWSTMATNPKDPEQLGALEQSGPLLYIVMADLLLTEAGAGKIKLLGE